MHRPDLPAGNRSTDRTLADPTDAGNRGFMRLLAIFGRDLGILGAALESAGMVNLGQNSVKILEEPEL